MASFFIDTTDSLFLGLLDDSYNWIEYCHFDTKKSSTILHLELNELLLRNKIKINDLQNIFNASGPGSYTGIRLAEVILQILEWHDLSVFSFYHFEVPALLGVKEGCWMSQAFKGEYFLYNWSKKGEPWKDLVKKEDVDILPDKTFSFRKEIDSCNVISTNDLIKDNPSVFFELLYKRSKRLDPYYYRSLDQEFNKGK